MDELRRWAQVRFRDADPGDEFPRVLHEYTEGIPLNVVHVLHAFAESGGIWYGGTRWDGVRSPVGPCRQGSPSSSSDGCNASRPRRG